MHDAKQCSDKFICEEIGDGGFCNMYKGYIDCGARS